MHTQSAFCLSAYFSCNGNNHTCAQYIYHNTCYTCGMYADKTYKSMTHGGAYYTHKDIQQQAVVCMHDFAGYCADDGANNNSTYHNISLYM